MVFLQEKHKKLELLCLDGFNIITNYAYEAMALMLFLSLVSQVSFLIPYVFLTEMQYLFHPFFIYIKDFCRK